MASIGSMDDIQNLFKETIAEFMENGLEAELDNELGYSKYDYIAHVDRLEQSGVGEFISRSLADTACDCDVIYIAFSKARIIPHHITMLYALTFTK